MTNILQANINRSTLGHSLLIQLCVENIAAKALISEQN